LAQPLSTPEILLVIAGMPVVTLLTRGFFLLPSRQPPLPRWLDEALRYAPLAALAAVAAPDVLLRQGEFIAEWRNARWWGAGAGALYFAWRRSLLGTLLCGTGVMLALRLGLGW
jgi:branched-subunit amino acid transport protein